MGTPSQGAQALICMDSSGIDSNSEAYEFAGENLGLYKGLIDHGEETIRGTRSHSKERVSHDVDLVGGWIHFYPSPAELANLLPRILGTSSGNTYSVLDSLPTFNVMIYRVAETFTYAGCVVNQAIFTFQKGKRMKLSLEIWAVSETAGDTFPAAVRPDLDTSYTMTMAVLTLQAAATAFDNGVTVVNNHLQRSYNNSIQAAITSRDRTVYLACSTPYTSDEITRYSTPVASSAGAAASIVATNGNQSLQLNFANLKLFAKAPTVKGKTEIRLPLKYKAYRSGTTKEIEIISDASA